jgi:hypothetical protein
MFFGAIFFLALISACGTLDVSVEEPIAAQSTPSTEATSTGSPSLQAATPAAPTEVVQAIAWYGTVHKVPDSDGDSDYFKAWHLAIWPKFGRAVGLTGVDLAVNAEIERLRDRDTKASFWGDLICSVADYGGCQLLVERISADDGGPQYAPDSVDGWTGRIGRLPVQPGSQNDLLYFVVDGPEVVLYGIAGDDPAIQAELEHLAGQTVAPEAGEGRIRVWGTLTPKAQPVTGTVIRVTRLESVSP